MTIADTLRTATSEPARKLARDIRYRFTTKDRAELAYWTKRFQADGGRFKNSHYERRMLAMAGEPSDGFLQDAVVADFGCGPRGSLVWAKSARLRVGIDVLADRYADEFAEDLVSHDMVYLKSTERTIPLPSDFVDFMFTLNAMDHVESFETMCAEVLRVLKPGGELIASFNIHEPASRTEPQRLDEESIEDSLLSRMIVQSRRTAERGPADDLYGPMMAGGTSCPKDKVGFLWTRATKPRQ
jgi:SAM-dependent methyltransferase